MKNRSIIWDIPKVYNKIYIYKLISTLSEEPRYIGITNNPSCRLSHHIAEKIRNHKNNWIKSVIRKGGKIQMVIFDHADTLEKALTKEEKYISKFNNLTNLCLTPLQGPTKKCYLYDLQSSEIKEFNSVQSVAFFTGLDPSTFADTIQIKRKYLFSYYKNFESLLEEHHIIKLKQGDVIKKALSYQHAAWIIGCTRSMINLCLRGDRKQVKGWIVCHKGKKFPEYSYRTEKPVKCITDGKTFDSIKATAKHYKLDESCITKCCKGSRKSCGKKQFKYN